MFYTDFNFNKIASLKTQTERLCGFLRKSQSLFLTKTNNTQQPRIAAHMATSCCIFHKIRQQCSTCFSSSTSVCYLMCCSQYPTAFFLQLSQTPPTVKLVFGIRSTKYEPDVDSTLLLSTSTSACQSSHSEVLKLNDIYTKHISNLSYMCI